MITRFLAVLLCSTASAGVQGLPPPQSPAVPAPAPQTPATPAAPQATQNQDVSAVHASVAAAPSVLAADALGVSTYTVSTLYTGDRVRDPFLPPSVGGVARPHSVSIGIDIHALELHGIMKDEKNDFAIFSTDTGARLILRDGRLYDDHNKLVPGITGFIKLKKKRAELMTADKDVQIYTLGASDDKTTSDGTDETEETGSGRSP